MIIDLPVRIPNIYGFTCEDFQCYGFICDDYLYILIYL